MHLENIFFLLFSHCLDERNGNMPKDIFNFLYKWDSLAHIQGVPQLTAVFELARISRGLVQTI